MFALTTFLAATAALMSVSAGLSQGRPGHSIHANLNVTTLDFTNQAKGNLTLPPEGYTIHITNTPLSVVFSRYSTPIPIPALQSTYNYIYALAMSKGKDMIMSSQHWVGDATLNLYPQHFTMTWQDLSYTMLALESFAHTQIGFRFDVYKQGVGKIGMGAVFGKSGPRNVKGRPAANADH
ncbi:MAG: hypothetical protein L6R40_001536 [Gallowayella cf. fulva]|nr:MAG: hypothetical protein L6R40_001536 [Xanthomendoza cf. fulva]